MASYSGGKYQPISLRISENTRGKYFYLFSSGIVVNQISHKIELKETHCIWSFPKDFSFSNLDQGHYTFFTTIT